MPPRQAGGQPLQPIYALADKERREIEIVRRDLPAQMSETEVAAAVDEIIRELGVTPKTEMGRIDERLANQLAASQLA